MDRSIQAQVATAVSATERIPGATFRTTVARFVEQNPGLSREALARELRERLAARGIEYHLRTLKRQISGAVATVPPEVLTTLRTIISESPGSGALAGDEKAAMLEKLRVDDADVQPIYVARERILPFAELWLYLHPEESKRALAMRLRAELEKVDIRLNIDSLQSILAGKQQLVRREVKEALLRMMQSDGIENAAQAEERWQQMGNEIRTSHEGRFFENAHKIHEVAREWKVIYKEPSSRKLAIRLRQKLADRGVEMGLPHIQKLVDGRAHRIRHGVALAIENILRDEMAAQSKAAAAVETQSTDELDLSWVRAEPIAEMAQKYVAEKSGMTMRKLSIQISTVVERYGYATSPNTIQPILGGHKKKTRGFIYRAMMEISGQHAPIVPHTHVLSHAARRDRERRTQPSSASASEAPAPSEPQPGSHRRPISMARSFVNLTSDAASVSRSPFAAYRSAIARYRALDRDTELELAWRYRRDGDQAAARALVESHLQFVVKVASQYRGYGMQLSDLVEEGNLGLLEAVRRFEPSRNLRFKTYAIYWIRAFVVEHLLREWSIVGGGTGALVSRTFFRLRRERARLESQLGEGDRSIDATLAQRFHTSEETIRAMTQRVGSRDTSLDAASAGGEGLSLLDVLSDPIANPELQTVAAQRNAFVRSVVNDALASFDSRERLIVTTRLLTDDEDEMSLADLGRRLGVSRERVRQLEERTKSKLRNAFAAVANPSFDFGAEALCA